MNIHLEFMISFIGSSIRNCSSNTISYFNTNDSNFVSPKRESRSKLLILISLFYLPMAIKKIRPILSSNSYIIIDN